MTVIQTHDDEMMRMYDGYNSRLLALRAVCK